MKPTKVQDKKLNKYSHKIIWETRVLHFKFKVRRCLLIQLRDCSQREKEIIKENKFLLFVMGNYVKLLQELPFLSCVELFEPNELSTH